MGSHELKDLPCEVANHGNANDSGSQQNEPEVTSLKPQGLRILLNFPPAIYVFLTTAFLEQYAINGLSAIFVMYLIGAYAMSPTTAKLIYHFFDFILYFTPIFGAVIDGMFGRYLVILSLAIISCVGYTLVTAGALLSYHLIISKSLTYIGLVIIALSAGLTIPSVNAFGADQFPSTDEAAVTQYFSIIYFIANFGAVVSMILTPIIRFQPCMQQDTCYPLALGVSAICAFLVALIFFMGTRWYRKNDVQENPVTKIGGCVFYALRQKCRSDENKSHWLDYAYPKYDQPLIDDVKSLFDIIFLYSPVVIFQALYPQIWSTWVIQGNQMNGRVGQLTILPDQMGALNPILIISLLPLFEGLIYPLLAKCDVWTRPLRRMCWGGAFIVLSFVVAGLFQLLVDTTAIKRPTSGHVRLTVINFLDCDMIFNDGNTSRNFPAVSINVEDLSQNISVTPSSHCKYLAGSYQQSFSSHAAYFISLFSQGSNVLLRAAPYNLTKTEQGKTRIYFVLEPRNLNSTVTVEQEGSTVGTVEYADDATPFIDVQPPLYGSNHYDVVLNECNPQNNSACTKLHLNNFDAITGAAHVLAIASKNDSARYEIKEIIEPNSISIMWQIPQFVIITVAEVLFMISGFVFSYSQASPRMKASFQAVFVMTMALGNSIDMGLSGSGLFEDMPAIEFFSYGGIMAVVMVLFVVLVWRYKDKSQRNHAVE